MAKELNAALASGLTLTANTYTAGAVVTSGINMTEIGATGLYYGDMTGAAGTYQVLFFAGSETLPRAAGQIIWDGAQEITANTANLAKVTGITVRGTGTENDPWRP